MDKSLVDHLYAHSRHRPISKRSWKTQVRLATAITERLNGVDGTPWALMRGLLSEKSIKATRRQFAATPGTLALAFHGGFPQLRRKAFRSLFENGVMIANMGPFAVTDGTHALFAAREAILDARPVLIAPDGGRGKISGVINVLGARRVVADGAPFLAFETGCQVLWFDVRRARKFFELQTAVGPRVEPGESFAAYRERFYGFYAACIEDAFTGDPRNIAMNTLWTGTFDAMFRGRVPGKGRLLEVSSASRTFSS